MKTAGDAKPEAADAGAKAESSGNGDDEAPTNSLFPLRPAAEAFNAKPIEFDATGYPRPEKVHILAPEIHMEYND